MSRIQTFLDALEAYLPSSGTLLPELTSAQVLMLESDDPKMGSKVDQHIKLHCMKVAGLAVIILHGGGTNIDPDTTGQKLHSKINLVAYLYVHSRRWGKKWDGTKRDATAILEDLLNHLHGAEIAPLQSGCITRLVVDDWEPEPEEDGFIAWSIPFHRILTLG
tara:strand:- start:212 stop:700 length:489 start_codon:yes stop_codon:yes gene_type:complete